MHFSGTFKSERQGVQSTKKTLPEPAEEDCTEVDSKNQRTHDVWHALAGVPDLKVGYMNLTGFFPQRLFRVNDYLLAGFHRDSNYVCTVPIKNREGSTATEAWTELQKNSSRHESKQTRLRQ